MLKKLLKTFVSAAMVASMAACSDSDNPTVNYDVVVNDMLPSELTPDYSLTKGSVKLTEVNTGSVYNFDMTADGGYVPAAAGDSRATGSGMSFPVPAGVYNIEASATYTNADGVTRNLRAVASSVVVQENVAISLEWFFYNPTSSLVFKEISVTGSPKATGSGALFDSFFTIYNNSETDVVITGVALCESKLINNTLNLYDILTPAHDRQVAFTAQTVYVIPSKPDGTPYTLAPGESIKIVDQAQDFTEAGGIDNRNADFEWYDVVNSTNANALDTDNPDVPNLEKWYSYSLTKWIVNQQCNRSYILFRLPDGMTAEQYIADYAGYYQYVAPTTGTTREDSKSMRVPNEWIIDGVNLSNSEEFVHGWVGDAIDMSYAKTSNVNTERYGHMAKRKVASVVNGREVLMDTNDSLVDFEYVSYK